MLPIYMAPARAGAIAIDGEPARLAKEAAPDSINAGGAETDCDTTGDNSLQRLTVLFFVDAESFLSAFRFHHLFAADHFRFDSECF